MRSCYTLSCRVNDKTEIQKIRFLMKRLWCVLFCQIWALTYTVQVGNQSRGFWRTFFFSQWDQILWKGQKNITVRLKFKLIKITLFLWPVTYLSALWIWVSNYSFVNPLSLDLHQHGSHAGLSIKSQENKFSQGAEPQNMPGNVEVLLNNASYNSWMCMCQGPENRD